MTNINTSFDKIYVISGKNCADRRQYINQTLEELNINFDFFDAVIGEDLSENEINKMYDENLSKNNKACNRALSKAEIGTALSHFKIYKEIINHNYSSALIFEDDISPVHENLSKINKTLEELPPDWDILYLGTLNKKHNLIKPPLNFKLKLIFYYPFASVFTDRIQYKYRHLWNFYPKHYSKSLKRAGQILGAHSYVISKKGAERVLSSHPKISAPVDSLQSEMNIERQLNSFISQKTMFKQNNRFESMLADSRNKRWNDRN